MRVKLSFSLEECVTLMALELLLLKIDERLLYQIVWQMLPVKRVVANFQTRDLVADKRYKPCERTEDEYRDGFWMCNVFGKSDNEMVSLPRNTLVRQYNKQSSEGIEIQKCDRSR